MKRHSGLEVIILLWATFCGNAMVLADGQYVTFDPYESVRMIDWMPFSIESIFNNHTVLRGALKSWDHKRLQRKHRFLDDIGGVHLKMINKYGDNIDGYHLSSANFLAHFFAKSARLVKIQLKESIDIQFEDLLLSIDDQDIPIKRMPFNQKNFRYFERINALERFFSKIGLSAKQDEWDGSLLVFKPEHGHLFRSSVNHRQVINKRFFSPELERVTSINDKPVLALAFSDEKYFDEVRSIFDGLGFGKAGFILKKIDKQLYLFRQEDLSLFTIAQLAGSFTDLVKQEDAEVSLKDKLIQAGVVILSMNQTDVYEQYVSEIMVFLFMGIDVIVYNNSSKGLSIGRNKRGNINSALETAYLYSKTLKFPDEKIMFKGQCFGAMPSSYLAKKYPQTNIWIDQAGSNMTTMAHRAIDYHLEKAHVETGRSFISSTMASLFPGYRVADNLSRNQGHKLLTFNIVNNFDVGGDHLVYNDDVDALVDAINQDNKYSKLVYLPGGHHVTSWFIIPYTRLLVRKYLKDIGMGTSLLMMQ